MGIGFRGRVRLLKDERERGGRYEETLDKIFSVCRGGGVGGSDQMGGVGREGGA